uniref:Uncharacterized protein n=1 Tax=Arundo donax TaxID=35708 RepID=A0A0A9AJ66_ARUDO
MRKMNLSYLIVRTYGTSVNLPQAHLSSKSFKPL